MNWNYAFLCSGFAELFDKITPPVLKIDYVKIFGKTCAIYLRVFKGIQ